MAIFITGGESSHFPISKQTEKVQFSLDASGKCFSRVAHYFFSTRVSRNGFGSNEFEVYDKLNWNY